MLCGATNVVFEGTPTYPTPARSWQVVEKFKVSFWCTVAFSRISEQLLIELMIQRAL